MNTMNAEKIQGVVDACATRGENTIVGWSDVYELILDERKCSYPNYEYAKSRMDHLTLVTNALSKVNDMPGTIWAILSRDLASASSEFMLAQILRVSSETLFRRLLPQQ